MGFKTKRYDLVLAIFIAVPEKEILTLGNGSINTHTNTNVINFIE